MSAASTANVVQLRDVPSVRESVSPEEWQARIDLAAAYRLSHHYNWADSIYNHISMRVPGEPHMFLIKAHELLYNEVTASNLVKVDMRDDEVDESYHVNKPGFVLHAGLLQVRPDVNSCFHTHIPSTIAVSNQKEGLQLLSIAAMRFYKEVGYHDFQGITDDLNERAAIAEALGTRHTLLMRNHGAVTVGKNVRDAFELMKALAEACDLQLRQQAAGVPFVQPDETVLEKTRQQRLGHDSGRGQADWPATLRKLDMIDPSYRD
jgi:ribulose-5-phosphate 4-epimerase/fuculose-1-phosphate aldolase